MSLIIIIFVFVLLEMFLAIRLYEQKVFGRHVYLMLIVVLLTSNFITLLYSLGFYDNKKIILANSVLTSTFASVAILFFPLVYLASQHWMKPSRAMIFLGDSVLALIVISSLDPGLLNESGLLQPPLPFNVWIWHSFHEILWQLVLILAIVLIIKNMSFRVNMWSPAFFLGIATFLPLLPNFLDIKFRSGILDIQLAFFVLSALVIGIALSSLGRRQLFYSRSYVVDNMSDGWLLLDSELRVVDINSSAERLLEVSWKKLSGKNAVSILSYFPTIAMALKKDQEVEIRTSVSNQQAFKYVHLKLSRVENSSGVDSGYLLFLRDDTERRKLDVARQNAKNEMFGLLHSIAGAASRSENGNEFISAMAYQLNYSFQGTSTAIFLCDEQVPKNRLLLVSQVGVDDEYLKLISSLDKELDFITRTVTSHATFHIREAQREKYLPKVLKPVFKGDVLAMPIFAKDVFVGLIIMTRENNSFRKDEITRVELAVQQIGSFVHNDRRRHLASTIAERQRLIRDLHDSVAQRLYGLVMMTEAARLGFSTGSVSTNYADFIEQLGFSARQALKEMRLFLYKLQPVDFRGGFVSVLMRRLDAVEGRGGLDVDLNIDQEIVLPPEDELHLFMIAQEALNNIIKHANANQIQVSYQKVKDQVSLEIRDNGSGFSPGEASRSGLGLQSMAERAEILGGTMKISASPGEGTKIVILVPEKEMALQEVTP